MFSDENALNEGLPLRDAKNYIQGQDDAPTDGKAEAQNYAAGLKLFAIMLALCLAVFCVALDNTIIATAIPKITDDFHSLQDVGWYGSAYLLTTCAFQLLFGKLYTYFSVKRTFLATLFVFEVGSLICGVAPNSVAFIVGRAIAGLGSAGLFSGALITVAFSTPVDKRPAYVGLVGGMYGIASVAGPLIGGAFTSHVTWRWCFYINLPIGGVSALVVLFILGNPKSESQGSLSLKEMIFKLDLPGTVVFVPAIICILLALQWGGTTYAWSNSRIIALLVLFVVLLIVFIGIQLWMGEDATVPRRIITQRTVAFGSVFAFCLGGSFFIFVYYIPIWLQAIKADSPIRSGIDTLPFLIAQVLIMVFTGVVITKVGYYVPFLLASTIFMSVGAGLLTTFRVDTPAHTWIGYTIIYGIGAGFGFQLPTVAVQTVLALKDVPTGTATIMFAQLLGGALFISAGENVFLGTIVSKLTHANISGIDVQGIAHMGATELRSAVAPQDLERVLVAYNEALLDTYRIGLILSCISLVGAAGMQWKSVKGKKIDAMAA